MSKQARIICTCNTKLNYDDNYDYIGVDAGALWLMQNGFPIKQAIGDFDSIDQEIYNKLTQQTKVVRLNPIKDDTDTEHAINLIISQYDQIEVYGACGGRLDHFIALYHLLAKLPAKIKIIDEQNIIYALEQGEHIVTRHNKKYLSFFTLMPSQITLEGVQYPLNNQKISVEDTYMISNEIIQDRAKVVVHSGKVLVVQSSDKKNNDH